MADLVTCPTEPEEWSGAEGCGEVFTAEPDDDGYVECASCGLSFDIRRTHREPVPAADTGALPTWQRVTQYTISAVPEGLCVDGYAWDVTVEWRSEGQWAVKHHSYCVDSNGDWDYEPSSSNRTDDWKATHRFPEEEALRLAHLAAPQVCINGYRPADLIAKYRQSEEQADG